MRKSFHLLRGGMILPLLASWLRTSSTEDPNKIFIRSGIERREQQTAATCIGWPPEDPGILVFGKDGSAPLCGQANDLLVDTWNTSAQYNNAILRRRMDYVRGSEQSLVAEIPDNGLDVDCAQYPRAQIVQLLQASRSAKILECAANRRPYVVFVPPLGGSTFEENDMVGPILTVATTSKDGLAELAQEIFFCVDGGDDCIIPETFRISRSTSECMIFFDLLDNEPSFADRQWLLKPTNGYGGDGIKLVQDIQTELKDPYGSCDGNQTGRPVVVQRYVQPYLIDGHAFHFRTYSLFKYGNEAKNDTAQAWRIDAGNFFICSEPYSQINDLDLQSFALTCNTPSWLNPRASRTTQWVLSLNEAKEMFSSDIWDLIMENVARVFNKLALIFTHGEIFARHLTLWSVLAVDLVIDNDYRAWVVDLNPCHKNPWEYDPDNFQAEWNPYISILRIVLSHYRRVFLNDDTIDEAACSSITFSTTVRQVFPNTP